MFLEQNYSKFGLVAFFLMDINILELFYYFIIHMKFIIISLEKLSIRVFGL